jgi:hypothetical protein
MADATTRKNIRVQILHTNSSDACEVLTDEFIDLMYADAVNLTASSDALA